MGGFLSAFKTKESASVVLDFENATPSAVEQQTHTRMQHVLDRAEPLLASLRSYEGCQPFVQKAISTPTNENLAACWEALKPAVAKLREYYEYGLEVEEAFPELMTQLCDGGAKLDSMQALAKQLAALLDFVIRFDHIKMNTPSIQNDFSYYRRSMTRMKNHNQEDAGALGDEVANRMSLFYASATPAMSQLAAAVTKSVERNAVTLEVALNALSVMASSTRDMLRNRQFTAPATNLFCLRTMVASVILYDQLDVHGAFCKRSPINVRSCVAVLREWPDALERVALANMLRFTSRHLKDETTLPGVAEALTEAAESGGAAVLAGGAGNNNNNNNNNNI